MESILVAFSGEKSAARISELLESSGTARCVICHSCAEVCRIVSSQHIRVVLCGYKMADGTAEDLLESLPDTCSMLMIAPQTQLDWCGNDDILKLPSPVSRSDLIASVRILLQFQHRLERAARPRRSAEEQAIVQRAKELLMSANGMEEEAAHRFLQRRSMESGSNLVETARLVLEKHIPE